MPIYDFECRACGERFEELVPSGTDEHACPKCGAPGAVRLFSSVAPPARLNMTPRQRRAMEEKRRGAPERAKQRFVEKRRNLGEAASRRESTGGEGASR